MENKTELSPEQHEELTRVLKARFEKNMNRHKGRRSICYDQKALESRKEHKPKNSAVNMAAEMGIDLLTEEQYRELQKLGIFDTKTSSWVKTPAEIRKLGGAIFADFRYGNIFVWQWFY